MTKLSALQSACARAEGELAARERELAALKRERDELRLALEQCLRRLDTLNTGGMDEPDPTVTMVRALLKRTKA